MSTSHLYHTQGIRGFKLKRLEHSSGVSALAPILKTTNPQI